MFSCLTMYYYIKDFVKETQAERLNNDPEKSPWGSSRDVVMGNNCQPASSQIGKIYSSQGLNLERQRCLSLWDSDNSWYSYCEGNRFYKCSELRLGNKPKCLFLLAQKWEILRLSDQVSLILRDIPHFIQCYMNKGKVGQSINRLFDWPNQSNVTIDWSCFSLHNSAWRNVIF